MTLKISIRFFLLLILLVICNSYAKEAKKDDDAQHDVGTERNQLQQQQTSGDNKLGSLQQQQQQQQEQQNQQQMLKPHSSSKSKRGDKKPKLSSSEGIHDFLYGSGGFAKVFQLEKKKPSPSKKTKGKSKTRKPSIKSGRRKTSKGAPRIGANSNDLFHDTSSLHNEDTDTPSHVVDSPGGHAPNKQNKHNFHKEPHQISNELQPTFDEKYSQYDQQLTPEELVRSYLENEEYSRLLHFDDGQTTQGNIDGPEYNKNNNNDAFGNAVVAGVGDERNRKNADVDGNDDDDDDDDDGDNDDDDDVEDNEWGRRRGGNADELHDKHNSFETLQGKHSGNSEDDGRDQMAVAHHREYYGSITDYSNAAAAAPGSLNVGGGGRLDGYRDITTEGYVHYMDHGSAAVHTIECPRSCICQESIVDCSGQNFTSVPKGISPLTTILDLSMNNIARLPEDTFAHLTHLEQLRIVGNNLTRLPKKIFKYNTLLRLINLQGNKFEKVPPRAFQNIQYLLELHLDDNRIKSIPRKAFKGLSSLQQLRLDANLLDHIPSEAMKELTGLLAVSLAMNQITKVPAYTFHNNTRLIHIGLANNRIEEIEDNGFHGLSKLKYLQLERNMIHEMSTSLSHLVNLEEINLERNRLTYLPDKSFQFKDKLSMLVLRNNPIKSIGDKAFSNLPSLTELVLSEVHDLVRFPDLTGTNRLKIIQLDRANIKSLPKDLCRYLPNITSFDVHSNKIGTVPNMSLCSELSNLNMANNELTSLDGQLFKGLSNLHDLTLSNNFIHTIPDNAFVGLSTLEYLNLAENQISYIHPDAFVPLKSLRDLNLGENHIGHLPTAGLVNLQKLKVFHNKELREFPPKEAFPNINHFVLAYAYHCCDFIHSRSEPPTDPDFVENLTILHPDSRVSDVLRKLHHGFSEEQLKLYEHLENTDDLEHLIGEKR